MMRLILSFLLVSGFKTCLCDVEAPAAPAAPVPLWCYKSQETGITGCRAPGEWNWVNVACCGAKQSPINIVDSETRKPPHTTELKFTGYDVEQPMKMRNDKRTVWLEIPPGATLTWGQISYKYKAVRIDFHWGEDENNPGSEHTIGGIQYPMEMQVLHLKDTYNNMEEAKKDPTGVAILAFLIEGTGTDENAEYAKLVASVNEVKEVTEPATESPVNITLNNLILTVEEMKDYYSYQGSVTKPDCQPAIWIVFKNRIQLKQDQVDAFYAVKDGGTNDALVKNYRPVQPLHGRVVYAGGIIPSSGAVLGVSFTFILMCLIAALGCFQLV